MLSNESLNDSLNDSDETLNYYNSKKIIETYRTQCNNYVPFTNNKIGSFTDSNHEETFAKGKKTATITRNSKSRKIKKKTNSPDASPEIVQVCHSTDDSLEIIDITEHDNSKRKKRRTLQRIRNKSSQNLEVDDMISKKSCQDKKKSSKTKCKPHIEEITLDESEKSADDLEDDINPEVSVKIIWKSVSVKKFKIRKFQKISKIFEELAKEENVPINKILLTLNDVKVNPNDTPDSLNIKPIHFIDGGVLSELTNFSEILEPKNSPLNSDNIILKFQDANKRVVNIKLNKNEKIKVGMIKCSEQLELPVNKIKFYFDGESVASSETPASLGLENNDIIDFKICE